MSQVSQTIDAAVSAAASKSTLGGTGFAAVSWMTASNIGMALGILVAILGLVVNFYYKRKEDRRLEQVHVATLANLALSNQLVAAELENEVAA